MFKITGFILGFMFILFQGLFAQTDDFKFVSSVDKRELSAGEILNFKISLEGNFKVAPQIEPPPLEDDFDVISTMRSQHISLGGRSKKKIFVINIVLLAKKEGVIKIGAAKLKLGFKSYITEPIEIIVNINEDIQKRPFLPPERVPVEGEDAERITL